MKKLLCVLLAAVLALTLMIPCAAAEFAGFTDQQEIKNINAVRMLCDLGLISGYSDGSFGPQNPIRREEVAKLMALLCEADPQPQNGAAPFYDISTSWAAELIIYCAERGIMPEEYTPAQVKQSVVGYGRAEKKQVMEMTRSILHLPRMPRPDDAADALALAICHAHTASSHFR